MSEEIKSLRKLPRSMLSELKRRKAVKSESVPNRAS